jgi:hypothetical protein
MSALFAKSKPTTAILAKAREKSDTRKPKSLTTVQVPWYEKLINHPETRTTLFSVLIHGSILVILSMIAISSPMVDDMLKNVLIAGDGDTQSIDVSGEAMFDLSLGSAAASLESMPDIVTEQVMASDKALARELTSEMASMFKEGVGQGEGEGKEGKLRGFGGFGMPSSGRAVTKGSFAAWTDPEDPSPGEDYKIIILVKLPDRISKYRASDLTGMVIGSDRYRQSIPGPEYLRGTNYLPVEDGVAQLIVKVPGADRLVKDTIKIRSKLLNEEQDLDIEF